MGELAYEDSLSPEEEPISTKIAVYDCNMPPPIIFDWMKKNATNKQYIDVNTFPSIAADESS